MTRATTFSEYARSRRPHIEKELRQVLKLHQLQAETLGAEYQELYHQLVILLRRGGKRLRPLLFLLAYEGYGGGRTRAGLEVAVAFELLHGFLLIHDDVIDRDFQRWGGPNISGVYFEKYSRQLAPREAQHMAESQAILAGDICASLSQSVLLESGFEFSVKSQLMQLQQRTLQRVMSGELTDIAQSRSKKPPTADAILSMYQEKTSSYSFVLPLVSAAICAGDVTEISLLESIGEQLGVAYQLQDDLQSVFSDQIKTGKPLAGDIREGKRTLMLVKALENATPKQQQTITRVSNKAEITTADINAMQQIIIETGAREYVQTAIQHRLTHVALAIDETLLSDTAKYCLRDLITQYFTLR